MGLTTGEISCTFFCLIALAFGCSSPSLGQDVTMTANCSADCEAELDTSKSTPDTTMGYDADVSETSIADDVATDIDAAINGSAGPNWQGVFVGTEFGGAEIKFTNALAGRNLSARTRDGAIWYLEAFANMTTFSLEMTGWGRRMHIPLFAGWVPIAVDGHLTRWSQP